MMKHQRRPCDGLPRLCPGKCNPRNRQIQQEQPQQQQEATATSCPRTEIVPEYHEQNIISHNVYYNHEFSLFSRKTQTDCHELLPRPLTPILSDEEREIIDVITRRVQLRKHRRNRDKGCVLRKIIAFLVFFFAHGFIALFAKDYQQYQTFLATQICGFITILFWDEA